MCKTCTDAPKTCNCQQQKLPPSVQSAQPIYRCENASCSQNVLLFAATSTNLQLTESKNPPASECFLREQQVRLWVKLRIHWCRVCVGVHACVYVCVTLSGGYTTSTGDSPTTDSFKFHWPFFFFFHKMSKHLYWVACTHSLRAIAIK